MSQAGNETLRTAEEQWRSMKGSLSPKRLRQLELISERIGHIFTNPSLLDLALTHKSWAHDGHGDCPHNQRMEFLGDSILSFVMGEHLFCLHQKADEGELSRLKAAVVSRRALEKVSRDLEIESALLLGRGEKKSGGSSGAILEDALEAVIAAVYMDAGLEVAREFILRHLRPAIEEAQSGLRFANWKSLLQEALQSRRKPVPEYRLDKSEGPENKKTFYISVLCDGELLAEGEGRSKREAETAAAMNAVQKYFMNMEFESGK